MENRNEKKDIFHSFMEKASARLKSREMEKRVTIYVPGIDEKLVIRSLSYDEIQECSETKNDNDPNAEDKYAIYLSVVEPNLKKVAMELMDRGEISVPTDVVNMFSMAEVTQISVEIMKLSGALSDKKVKVIEELKN